MAIQIEPIGYVVGGRQEPEDDFWGGTEVCIALTDAYRPESLEGIESFSHAEVLFFFHQIPPADIVTAARHPRNNPDWPIVGVFAQRTKYRPNRIGSTICRVLRHEGTRLHVAELDAIDGTPVIDIKPLMAEFLPRGPVIQPAWSHELMRRYWHETA